MINSIQMKKTIVAFCLMMAFTLVATAQTNDIELGKQYWDEERYDKALPYLQRATAAGDIDSKVRLAYMIFTMQVPQYSMDQQRALNMLDECIAEGSAFAMERKGWCIIAMSPDTREDKMKGVELFEQASELGYGPATARLRALYEQGLKSPAKGNVYIEPNDSLMMHYTQLAYEQGDLDGIAYVGLYTFEGSHGYDKDEAAGVQLLMKAHRMNEKLFAGNCPDAAYCLKNYYLAHGDASSAAALNKWLKKFYPSRY